MIFLKYIQFVFLLMHVLIISAQSHQNRNFYIRIQSVDNLEKPDSIKLRLSNDYYPDIEKFEEIVLIPDNYGCFTFSREIAEPFVMGTFYIYFANKSRLISGVRYYYMTPGDSISVTLKNVNYLIEGVFEGRGSEKYTCKKIIEQQRDIYSSSSITFEKNLIARKLLTDECIGRSSRFIDERKGSMDNSIYELLRVENSSYYYTQWITNVKYYYHKNVENILWKEILNIYEGYVSQDSFLNKQFASYVDYAILNQLSKTQFYLLRESDNKGFSYTSLYNHIKLNYSGEMRDKLLTMCLNNNRSFRYLTDYGPDEFIACVEDALSIVRDEYIKENLLNLMLYKRGAPVYNFSLVNVDGKKMNLEDFRGKVVLLDIWGKGCTGCASFHRRFKKSIYPSFKDNNGFEVVSVSIDEDKEVWMEGISGGKYTSLEYTNLYTNGKGIKDPFTMYYNLNAIPFILLIDKELRVYARIEQGFDNDKIIALINEALSM